MAFKLKSKPSPGCADKCFYVIFIEVEEFCTIRNSFIENTTKDEEVSPICAENSASVWVEYEWIGL